MADFRDWFTGETLLKRAVFRVWFVFVMPLSFVWGAFMDGVPRAFRNHTKALHYFGKGTPFSDHEIKERTR
jgi:hypothetical protein